MTQTPNITSNRKYGVEIEFLTPTEKDLLKIKKQLNIVKDGSLRPYPFTGEYVSPILKGTSGVETINKACLILKENRAFTTEKTSVHIHLDGEKKRHLLKKSMTKPTNISSEFKVLAFSKRVLTQITENQVEELLNNFLLFNAGVFSSLHSKIFSDTMKIEYISSIPLTKEPKLNYVYFWLQENSRFNWLKNVLYFYTKFSDVMGYIVSNSRRKDNMYCIPLADSYELSEIAAAKNEQELKNLWYKGNISTNRYDDSRYHNVNLHSYWTKDTVEIRSHGGTIDPDKIILWIKLHQKIVDKLENISFVELKSIGNTPKDFVEFVEETTLQEYVKRLLGFYSGITIK